MQTNRKRVEKEWNRVKNGGTGVERGGKGWRRVERGQKGSKRVETFGKKVGKG